MAEKWISGAIKHPGLLHRELGVPQGQKIPAKKLATASKAGGKLGERARLAETLKGFHHSQDEAHYDARRHTESLHEGIPHAPVDRETHRAIHHDSGDHTSGQSLPREEQETMEARSQTRRFPSNPHGNPGFHPSTNGFEHEGYIHTSKHR